MNDPRLTPANTRVAHASLRGKVDAERYTKGQWRQVETGVLPLLDALRRITVLMEATDLEAEPLLTPGEDVRRDPGSVD